jgi:type I restriction enzyme R subunit
MTNEPDTCRRFVVPKLQAAGWDDEPHSIAEQRRITDGRIVPRGGTFAREKPRKVDYLLRYSRDIALAVVEAKAGYRNATDGLQQSRLYAEMIGLKFAYATNGHTIIEIDYFHGTETEVSDFPTPTQLWDRYVRGQRIDPTAAKRLLTPGNYTQNKGERYYQQIAVNTAISEILTGNNRVLLTLATGTGKTAVAFQICWRLWESRWNRTGRPGRARMLYLADRNILVDDPKDKDFSVFGTARHKIESGKVDFSREMYFAIYQALAEDGRRLGLFKEYPNDFFDLVIVDECHRGSASDESSWRSILEYFAPAAQLGLTATPLRDDNRDTYRYFGNPVYQYSLRQGIEDGFLAPYRVHRVVTSVDATGFRPSAGDVDRYGRVIPDGEYHTKEFERILALRQRTRAIAKHLSDFMKKHGRYDKTIVFCVDQEHASEMRSALVELNADIVAQHPDYVCRVTAAEGDIGKGHLARFQDPEEKTPVILTTSQLLTTGVDAPTCRNIALARIVSSMSEFKQIIGRGTRVREEYGKLWFNILDYTGSATTLFADPEFDGQPEMITEDDLVDSGGETGGEDGEEKGEGDSEGEGEGGVHEPPPPPPRKFYFDGGAVEVVAHVVYELDPNGRQLRAIQYTEYAAERTRSICRSAEDLQKQWSDPDQRADVVARLTERGIDVAELGAMTGMPEADPFDVLCHLAFNAPLRTRRQRADRVRTGKTDFFDRYGVEARQILNALLDKYAEHGISEFTLPDILKVPPISDHGQISDIMRAFGGVDALRSAVIDLQRFLYAA